MKKVIISLVLISILGCAGSESDSKENTSKDNFDRSLVLKNYAENYIIPAFSDFDVKLNSLKTTSETFTTTPNETNLSELKTKFLEAYKVWQYVSRLNLGKAEALNFVNYFNVYKVNLARLTQNVNNGVNDFSHINNKGTLGFPALDYLLYEGNVMARFTTDAQANNYKKYLKDVVNKMIEVNTTILNDWKNNYSQTFVSSTGNTNTSSLNMLINDFIYHYEKLLRANKIGIPAGSFSKQGNTYPDEIEAYYSKKSKMLALEALKSVKMFFEGNSYDGTKTGDSFKTYLIALKRQDLADKIISQLAKAKTAIENLNDDFSLQIQTDNIKMTIAFDELQKVVVLFKTDMLQAFDVRVDYVDGDGD